MRTGGKNIDSMKDGFISSVKFSDPAGEYAALSGEIDQAIHGVVSSGRFIGGPEVDRFEEEFAAYCHADYSVGVGTGTDALFLTLKAAGIGPGDEVVTVPHTFIATVSAIAQTGATVVFADIDPQSYCLDPRSLEAVITPRTRAVVPVHLYGHPTDMDPLMEIANRHSLFVLEDACQAHGALYKGRRVGSLGHAAAFSFYPSKNLGAFGDGGAVTTNDEQLAANIRLLRDHGRITHHEHMILAHNSRLDALQAAVLRVKLRCLDERNDQRRAVAARYNARLSGVPGLTTPTEAPYARSVYHLYVVRTGCRAAVQGTLDAASIGHGIHYPVAVHRHAAWEIHANATARGQFPAIEQLSGEILSLPMHPFLTDDEIDYTCALVSRAQAAGITG